jgi:hypothetical protein
MPESDRSHFLFTKFGEINGHNSTVRVGLFNSENYMLPRKPVYVIPHNGLKSPMNWNFHYRF